MADHSISRAEAKSIIANYQATIARFNVKGGAFSSSAVLSILNQPGCVALRYYHALKPTGEFTIVLVGEDANGKALSDGMLAENPWYCPPVCPSNGLDE